MSVSHSVYYYKYVALAAQRDEQVALDNISVLILEAQKIYSVCYCTGSRVALCTEPCVFYTSPNTLLLAFLSVALSSTLR